MILAKMSSGENRFLFGAVVSEGSCEGIANEKLAYNTYRHILKHVLEKQGVDASSFGFHSCRSGGATELAQKRDAI